VNTEEVELTKEAAAQIAEAFKRKFSVTEEEEGWMVEMGRSHSLHHGETPHDFLLRLLTLLRTTTKRADKETTWMRLLRGLARLLRQEKKLAYLQARKKGKDACCLCGTTEVVERDADWSHVLCPACSGELKREFVLKMRHGVTLRDGETATAAVVREVSAGKKWLCPHGIR
jgi:hypothetical protein